MNTAYRKELKYIISTGEFIKIKSKIKAYLKPDENLVDGFYTVRSLYFDSINDFDLLSSVYGCMNKSKIRLRVYPPDFDKINLELKEKMGHDGLKTSLTLSKEEAQSLMKLRYRFLLKNHDKSALKIYQHLSTQGYLPKTIVEYKRAAFYIPVSKTRITFDYDIKVSVTSMSFFKKKIAAFPAMENGMGVLEIKYNNFLLGSIKNILKDIDDLTVANSKYVESRLLFD